MKVITAFLVFIALLSFSKQMSADNEANIMLPNPKLLNCATDHLWQSEQAAIKPIYPSQMHLDHFDQRGCPQGIVALYDKAVPFAQIKDALDQRYGKWSKSDAEKIKLWRVEPEKFAIQLAAIDDSEKGNEFEIEKGMKQVIYLSFRIHSASNQ